MQFFAEHDEEDALLIIYYAGNGFSPNREHL
jgi:hypothetical protein